MRWINEREEQIAWMRQEAHDIYDSAATALSDYEGDVEAFTSIGARLITNYAPT